MARKDAKAGALITANVSHSRAWLSVFLAVGLDFAKEVHGDHLPFDPDSCPRLAEIRSALQSSPTRRELLESIKSKLRAHLHPLNVYPAAGLRARAADGGLVRGSPEEEDEFRRRIVFTVLCLRGCIGGVRWDTLQLVPSDGWSSSADFYAWFRSPAVQADRAAKGEKWQDRRMYGSATNMSEKYAPTYESQTGTLLRFLAGGKATYTSLVHFLRDTKVRDSSSKAFPQVGGALTSIHVASDLANFGLLQPCSIDEMATLIEKLALGADKGLRYLGLAGGAGKKTSASTAFLTFAERFCGPWESGGLDDGFRSFLDSNGFKLTASNLENLLCKPIRHEFDFRIRPDFVAVYTSLPTVFNTSAWPEGAATQTEQDGLKVVAAKPAAAKIRLRRERHDIAAALRHIEEEKPAAATRTSKRKAPPREARKQAIKKLKEED
ncbi:hypothetical protein JCM8202_002854 [Rhodotorula sphaerocarpa]